MGKRLRVCVMAVQIRREQMKLFRAIKIVWKLKEYEGSFIAFHRHLTERELKDIDDFVAGKKYIARMPRRKEKEAPDDQTQ